MIKKYYKLTKDFNFFLKIKNNNLNILWYPKINSEIDLIREICRAVWYLNPIKERINELVFFVNYNLEKFDIANIIIPDYIDSTIKELINNFKNIKFITTKKDIKDNSFHIKLFWNQTNKKLYKTVNKFYPYVINGDTFNNQFEANHMMKFSNLFLEKNEIIENIKKLKKILTALRNDKKQTLLIGSGPSIKELENLNLDYNNIIPIICNSVIKNIDLLKKINPKITVVSDTVFHSGYSKYAEEFRKALVIALDLFEEMILIVPERDYKIYLENLPFKYKTRIYSIKSQNKKNFNLNILDNPTIKSTSNVLSLLMIPIASTISNNIMLIGFDGKTSKDKSIFWKYDDKSQFDTINMTKKAHPSFYKVSYDLYYEKHCSELQYLVNSIISKKINISNLAYSNIPILRELSRKND